MLKLEKKIEFESILRSYVFFGDQIPRCSLVCPTDVASSAAVVAAVVVAAAVGATAAVAEHAASPPC